MNSRIVLILSFITLTVLSAFGQCDKCPSTVTNVNSQTIMISFSDRIVEPIDSIRMYHSVDRSLDGRVDFTMVDSFNYAIRSSADVTENTAIELYINNHPVCPIVSGQSLRCGASLSMNDCPPVDPACDFSGCNNIINGLNAHHNSQQGQGTKWYSSPFSAHHMFRFGNVAIGGNDVQSNYKLSVQGGIRTSKFIIQHCEQLGWCDDVFGPEYKLPNLQYVRNYININGKLEGFPSATKVDEEASIDVKDITVEQQRKIEEAYLYVMELEKRIENLKKEK